METNNIVLLVAILILVISVVLILSNALKRAAIKYISIAENDKFTFSKRNTILFNILLIVLYSTELGKFASYGENEAITVNAVMMYTVVPYCVYVTWLCGYKGNLKWKVFLISCISAIAMIIISCRFYIKLMI